jgi:hypothetical protein
MDIHLPSIRRILGASDVGLQLIVVGLMIGSEA